MIYILSSFGTSGKHEMITDFKERYGLLCRFYMLLIHISQPTPGLGVMMTTILFHLFCQPPLLITKVTGVMLMQLLLQIPTTTQITLQGLVFS
jgi:hypothetical protein